MLLGRKLEVTNGDPVSHNVHVFWGARPAGAVDNWVQSPGARDAVPVENPELPLRIACDMHTWMRGYVFVLPHTLFSVTDVDGAFALPSLPAGSHDVIAWHEVYGESKRTVEVKAGASKSIEFTFEAPKK